MPSPTFDNSYTKLPERFYHRQPASQVPSAELIRLNNALADELGLDRAWLESDEGLAMLSGNQCPPGADPIATVYAGFQFGGWNPQLGDGRALLIGEVIAKNGRRYDLQLKGSGPTPYSRGGDGKSPLGPVLREYLISEAMHALGVPTTRSLAAVTTGEKVFREDGPLPGAILTRVASSHIRVGTVQFFASRQDTEGLRLLCMHVIERHYPSAKDAGNPVLSLLEQVVAAQAKLLAQWQGLGFIHGVMNTDNMLLCGETIDYGPCAFMDQFHSDKVYSSIDHQGRYAYSNQPGIAHWNLAGLAQALLPVLHDKEDEAVALAQSAVDRFPSLFVLAYQQAMARKMGFSEWLGDEDDLVQDFFKLLEQEHADFTLSFRRLTELAAPSDPGSVSVKELFDFGEAFQPWLARWRERRSMESERAEEQYRAMRSSNPIITPRNHRVEAAINAALEGDFSEFHKLADLLSHPFTASAAELDYARPPLPREEVRRTFCGT